MKRHASLFTIACLLALPGTAAAQQPTDQAADLAETQGEGPLADQAPGKRFLIRADNLPPPNAGPNVSNAPLVLPRQDHMPIVPDGFEVTALAENLTHPRRLLELPNGDIIVAEQKEGYLTLLRDGDGDGRAEWIQRHAEGFTGPYGMVWRDGNILVADQLGIWKVPHSLGQVRAGYGEQRPIGEVPPENRAPDPNAYGQTLLTPKGVFGIVAGHANRDLVEDPTTGELFVGVGSAGNIGVETPVKATIQRFAPDGSDQTTYASGLRNATGLAFHPDTGQLYAVVQERDGLGDRVPPDYLTAVREDGFYGWPYAYAGSNPQPGFADRAPEKVEASITPDVLFEAHSAAMALTFIDHEAWPADWQGDAIVALKGSWNRSDPTGYKLVRVKFEEGRPVGWYENFATGFWVNGQDRAQVWGRPADVMMTRDGALLVADDTSNTVWRITATGDAVAEQTAPTEGEAPSSDGQAKAAGADNPENRSR